MSEETAQAAAAPSTEETQEIQVSKDPGLEEAPPARPPDDGSPLVLVTGASGFVASHVIKRLLEEGKYRVRGTVRDATKEAKVQPIRDLVPNPAKPLELVSADLTSEEAWKDAVKGCTYVLHVASPFPLQQPKNEDELIRPAVEGTLNVLRACAAEVEANGGKLKRVVLVSSIAAVSSGLLGESKVYSEDDWSNEAILPPYEKSKYRAERAGWDYMEKLEEGKKFEFSVVCPAVVIGPALNKASAASSSLATVLQLLNNSVPGVPNINWPLVDVRDIASGLLAAMEKPVALNRRYLLANENPTPYREMAEIVAAEFKPQGYKIPTKSVGKVVMWLFSQVDSTAKAVRQMQGKEIKYNISRMTGELGITPHPMKDTILDTCYSLIDYGVVKKTPNYLGHPDNRPPPAEKPETDKQKEEEPSSGEPKAEEPPPEKPKAEDPPPEKPTAEEPPLEEAKAEVPPPEEAKAEEPPLEEAKAEEPPLEEPKAEEPPPEEVKVEEPPLEEVKAEEPPLEEPKAEEPPAEEPKAEEPPPPEELKADEPPAEEPKAEEPPPEEPKAEEPPAEELKAEEPPPEEPKAEEPPAEEPPPEEPKAEEPPAEEPKAEEPPPEEPKAEEPPAEEPKAEEPPPEEPKAEEPPPEESKAEEPPPENADSPDD